MGETPANAVHRKKAVEPYFQAYEESLWESDVDNLKEEWKHDQ